ncbi:MAG: chromosomal replication initiator protein DnaA [Bryobacteraceae bacterium]|nr:chromosomal replication initiator protein DnaA [Bryobacteraceae bacterium]
MDVWEQVKQLLASKLTEESFQNWLSKTRLDRVDGSRLVVAVPDAATKEWLEEEYGRTIRSALTEMRLPFQEVAYEAVSQNGTSGHVSGNNLVLDNTELDLNPKYTFDTFVVGACNQFAHAAAKAVAALPARRYNPLFIYGGVGMGKTHLMQAIGRSLVTAYGGMRVVYTTSERFMNELIHSIRTDKMTLFHQQYRRADALLIDDIHVIANKERTQEEFFHTFNDLYEHQKQIVISSDSPPKETAGLVDRLRSRFEWGLMVDIQPPDLETKMAILDRKAEIEGIQLPEDVRIMLATKTKSNVRELEGALVKLIAYSSLTGTNININMAQQALRYLTTGLEPRVTIDSIIRQVAERFALQPSQIKQKTNARKIAYPRQIAMYLAKELTGASLPEIGRVFGGKHHTTVLHSVQKIEKLRLRDPDLNRLIHAITDSLH